MKTKQILIVLITVLAVGGIFFAKWLAVARQIKARITGAKLVNKIDISKINLATLQQLRNLEIELELTLNNFSKKDIEVRQIFIEIYDGEKKYRLSEIIEPISPTTLKAGQATPIYIKAQINTANTLRYALSDGVKESLGDFIKLVSGFGDLNRFLYVKGFIRVKGLPIAISLNQKIAI